MTTESKERITIPVGGMHCASCVARVEGSLKKAPGVAEATVEVYREVLAA